MHGYRAASFRRLEAGVHDQSGEMDTLVRSQDETGESYCALMASPNGGLLDVSPDRHPDLTTFLEERKDTLLELASLVVIVSPDGEAQGRAIALLDAIVPFSLEPGQCSLLLVDCPRNMPPESAFGEIHAYLRDKPLDGLIVPAVMPATRAFEEAHVHKLSVSALVNATDIEGEFRAAREKGAGEKKLQNLGRRLMAARAVVAAAREFERVYDALGLPRTKRIGDASAS